MWWIRSPSPKPSVIWSVNRRESSSQRCWRPTTWWATTSKLAIRMRRLCVNDLSGWTPRWAPKFPLWCWIYCTRSSNYRQNGVWPPRRPSSTRSLRRTLILPKSKKSRRTSVWLTGPPRRRVLARIRTPCWSSIRITIDCYCMEIHSHWTLSLHCQWSFNVTLQANN